MDVGACLLDVKKYKTVFGSSTAALDGRLNAVLLKWQRPGGLTPGPLPAPLTAPCAEKLWLWINWGGGCCAARLDGGLRRALDLANLRLPCQVRKYRRDFENHLFTRRGQGDGG